MESCRVISLRLRSWLAGWGRFRWFACYPRDEYVLRSPFRFCFCTLFVSRVVDLWRKTLWVWSAKMIHDIG